MPVAFIMPKFDMDQETATISAWLKQEGDHVEADEAVLVVETQKVSIEVPAPATGTLAAVCARIGEVVPVTTVIAYILKPGETLADVPAHGGAAGIGATKAPASAETVNATPVAARLAAALGVNLTEVPAAGSRVTKADVKRYVAGAQDGGPTPLEAAPVAATPAARRLARERDLALETIAGTGPRGRVQADDVLAFAKAPTQASPIATPAGERPAQVVPLTGMRRTIADRMQASFHDLPHIALTVEADTTALEGLRARLNQRAERQGAGKLTLTALLVHIVAWALRRHPYLNASLVEQQLHLWQDVNIGVATALPDGLIVPVIHQADRLGLRALAEALGDLTGRARAGQLSLADVQNGTFTLSNLGMFGISQFRAIINAPECAILAVGAQVRRPVVINDRDEVAVRPMMNLTLSADHRVVDGVIAARFLQDIVQAIELPELMLYE